MVQPERPQMTLWRMRIASWILNTTNTQYVIIVAFTLQQCLHETTSILRYTYCTLAVLFQPYGIIFKGC